MRKLLLLALIVFSVQSVAFAYETKDVDCDAFAESTERDSKDVKSESKKNNTDDNAVISE
jgi:hypothetical protein